MTRDQQLIGPMASFIGARLQYPCPAINEQGNPWVSTITVDQHKEKFWYIRVYCKLADPDLVAKKWVWHQTQGSEARRHEFVGEAPTAEFTAKCHKHDAIHYRRVYMEMVALQPHLIGQICSQADYAELLRPTFKELSTELDVVSDQNASWVEGLLRKHDVAGLAELKQLLQVVYDPSWRDSMELRD